MSAPSLINTENEMQARIILVLGDKEGNAITLMNAYAQRIITLGELIKLRRSELGLTQSQVLEQSGYFLYRTRDLAQLENDELRMIHEIWFTILCEPLQLDYQHLIDAHEFKYPSSNLLDTQLVSQAEIEDNDESLLISLPAHSSRRSRACNLGEDWVTLQALARSIELTATRARTLIARITTLNPALSEMQQTFPLGKSRKQTLYHLKLAQYMLSYLKDESEH